LNLEIWNLLDLKLHRYANDCNEYKMKKMLLVVLLLYVLKIVCRISSFCRKIVLPPNAKWLEKCFGNCDRNRNSSLTVLFSLIEKYSLHFWSFSLWNIVSRLTVFVEKKLCIHYLYKYINKSVSVTVRTQIIRRLN
jgi:hypothetical protein